MQKWWGSEFLGMVDLYIGDFGTRNNRKTAITVFSYYCHFNNHFTFSYKPLNFTFNPPKCAGTQSSIAIISFPLNSSKIRCKSPHSNINQTSKLPKQIPLFRKFF